MDRRLILLGILANLLILQVFVPSSIKRISPAVSLAMVFVGFNLGLFGSVKDRAPKMGIKSDPTRIYSFFLLCIISSSILAILHPRIPSFVGCTSWSAFFLT